MTKDALRPRSDAGRGRRSEGERRRSPAGVIRRGIDSGGLLRGERPAYDFIGGQRMGEIRSSPRVNNVSGKAARREAASLLATADRRMSKLRLGCVSAMPQSMMSQSKRQTHFDRLGGGRGQGALRPSCPTSEAINPNRQTGVQRRKRSTSTAERVSNGRRAYHSNRRTGPRTKG